MNVTICGPCSVKLLLMYNVSLLCGSVTMFNAFCRYSELNCMLIHCMSTVSLRLHFTNFPHECFPFHCPVIPVSLSPMIVRHTPLSLITSPMTYLSSLAPGLLVVSFPIIACHPLFHDNNLSSPACLTNTPFPIVVCPSSPA